MNSAPATSAEARAGDARKISVAQVLVYELRVRDAMTASPVTALPGDSLRTIQQLMKHRKISGVPICSGDTVLGLVSIEDIITALDTGHINDPAEKWMARNVVCLRDHFSLVRAVAEFERHGFGRFPVVDGADRLVGILTRGDVTNSLMHALERRAEQAIANEAALLAAQTPDGAPAKPLVFKTRIRSGDFDSAGKVSQKIRQELRARAIDPDTRRRAAIVVYEAETNMIIHSVGGELTTTIFPDRVVIEAVDEGPGIEDVEMAMREGWSTAGPLARQFGFGAGMGIPNMKKCSDIFEIKSLLGAGTRVHSEVRLKKAEGPV